jgi:hypothetical protein
MKKLNIILLAAITNISVLAQPLSDSIIRNMSSEELGLHLLDKSHKQKAGGYVLLGVGMASAVAGSVVLTNEMANMFDKGSASLGGVTALGLISIGAAAGGGALLTAGAKNKGKSEMLLRKPGKNEAPGYELDLGLKYSRNARIKNTIAYALLGAGVTMNIFSYKAQKETIGNTMNTIGSIAIIASVPLFISAAGDKGRASVLLRNESIPFSYYSKPIGLKSVSISIPLGNNSWSHRDNRSR